MDGVDARGADPPSILRMMTSYRFSPAGAMSLRDALRDAQVTVSKLRQRRTPSKWEQRYVKVSHAMCRVGDLAMRRPFIDHRRSPPR